MKWRRVIQQTVLRVVLIAAMCQPQITTRLTASAVDFPKSFGDSGSDRGGETGFFNKMGVALTADGGFVVVGTSEPRRIRLVRFDATGSPVWHRLYLAASFSEGSAVIATTDGGFAIAGKTLDSSLLLKVDGAGNTEFSSFQTHFWANRASDIVQTADGGYALVGREGGQQAGYLIKFDAAGNKVFGARHQSTFAVIQDSNYNRALIETLDGGFAIAGSTYRVNGGFPPSNATLLRVDASGGTDFAVIPFQKTYGGSQEDRAEDLVQGDDGHLVLAGFTRSFGAGGADFWVFKVHFDTGALLWQKAYGGPLDDIGRAVIKTSDGAYVVAGTTRSFGSGEEDIWVIKLDADGNLVWEKVYGGARTDRGLALAELASGEVMVVGETQSFGPGPDTDFWMLKLDSDGNVPAICSIDPDTAAAVSSTSASVGSTPLFPNPSWASYGSLGVSAQNATGILQAQCPSLCGDGVIQFGEECEPPEQVIAAICPNSGKSCSNGCECVRVCGNGVRELPDEECDDGNLVSGDGCSAACETDCNDPDGDGFGNQGRSVCPIPGIPDECPSAAGGIRGCPAGLRVSVQFLDALFHPPVMRDAKFLTKILSAAPGSCADSLGGNPPNYAEILASCEGENTRGETFSPGNLVSQLATLGSLPGDKLVLVRGFGSAVIGFNVMGLTAGETRDLGFVVDPPGSSTFSQTRRFVRDAQGNFHP